MLDYAALAALAEIIRRGSFEAAAAALGVTPSAISQRIKGLEERMGEVLIHRGPPARGTAMGLRLMQHLDQVRVLEQALGTDPGAAPATLRLAINADSLATWVIPALARSSLAWARSTRAPATQRDCGASRQVASANRPWLAKFASVLHGSER